MTPYRRSTIGFDRLFDMLETSARQSSVDNYPPFNLEKLADDRYRITLAVAGFGREEIEITMAKCGRPTVASIDSTVVVKAPRL